MRLEYFGTKPNRAKRGPRRHSPRQNWLGNVMKRCFVHISLMGAKWIPTTFIPQKAFCSTLAAPELRNQDKSPSTQDSRMALLTPFMPYSLHYNTRRPNGEDTLTFDSFFLLFPHHLNFSSSYNTSKSLSVSRPSHYRQCHAQSQAARDLSVPHSLAFWRPYPTHPQRTHTAYRFRNIENTQSSVFPSACGFEPTAAESNNCHRAGGKQEIQFQEFTLHWREKKKKAGNPSLYKQRLL